MISGIVGLPGSGKTLRALMLLEQAVRAGRFCATNIRLTDACPFASQVALLDDDAGRFPVFSDRGKGDFRAFWHVLPKDSRPFVVIDEADNHWDSLDFSKLVATDVKLFFKQHRKWGYDVVYICQNLGNVYNRIRRMTQDWYLCIDEYRQDRIKRMFLPRSWCKFWAIHYADEKMEKKAEMGRGFLRWREAKRMFGWYDTEQLIGDPLTYAKWGAYAA